MTETADVKLNRAQLDIWTDLLTRLECYVLVYHPSPLPPEAWDDLAPLVGLVAPGTESTVEAVRAAASEALASHPEMLAGLEAAKPSDLGPSVDPGTSTAPGDRFDACTVTVSTVPGSAEPGSAAPLPAPPAVAPPAVAPPAVAAAVSVAGSPDGRDPRWVDVAAAVLAATGTEMNAAEILAYSAEHGPRRSSTGRTPTQTINRDLHNAIRRGDRRFRPGSSPGRFAAAT